MERIDDLQYKGLKMVQDVDNFCFGCDAVELANFVEGTALDRAVDLGSGSGIITILLAGKKGIPVTAVEIQTPLYQLAKRNIELNGLNEMATAVNMPMQEYARINPATATIVVCNPPYRKLGSGVMQQSQGIAASRHEIFVTLKGVAETAARLLSTGGRFYMILPVERFAEAISYCREVRLEPKVVQILTPNEKKPPHLFMMKCVKDGKCGLTMLKERGIKTYGVE